jgi:hypothetical protein
MTRLYQVAGATTTRFAYDGVNALAEYDGGNALQRRYMFGPGIDNPIVQYEGSGTTDRRFMGKDERGSIISLPRHCQDQVKRAEIILSNWSRNSKGET